MASISLKGIYKIYPGDVTAVSDFNLEIEDKEFIILVGPSAKKSWELGGAPVKVED